MRTPDSFLAEFTARLRGAPPRLPLWSEAVHWGGRRYRVEASDSGWVLLCPHPCCLPVRHEHLRLGPLGLAFLRWDADVSAFVQVPGRAAAA
jgi:hypothetical protein